MIHSERRRDAYATSPVDAIVHKLDGVRGSPPKCRATCPACARKGALSVGEGRDGQALLRCFAGCELRDVAGAMGMTVADLFAAGDARERDRERFAARRRFTRSPAATVHAALDTELDTLRARLRAEIGYDRPLRAADINGVRERVCRLLGLAPATLPAVPPFAWERPPHDEDPAWPALYMRALEDETRRFWHALHPEAQAWETDPHGPGFYDHLRAERLAREWLQAMAS